MVIKNSVRKTPSGVLWTLLLIKFDWIKHDSLLHEAKHVITLCIWSNRIGRISILQPLRFRGLGPTLGVCDGREGMRLTESDGSWVVTTVVGFLGRWPSRVRSSIGGARRLLSTGLGLCTVSFLCSLFLIVASDSWINRTLQRASLRWSDPFIIIHWTVWAVIGRIVWVWSRRIILWCVIRPGITGTIIFNRLFGVLSTIFDCSRAVSKPNANTYDQH